ncbi:isochorismate synthase [Microbacterium sp. LRZ72]|uniref:isochorismate synthase n=1 Tax=Microbacterium sp. LRZ72 TaxID=2942481 RepID=UPI0029BA17C2|nr:isochorismate synthase [Microbacterium sp. LRZ72]MDX2377322.1 isochorismate synthase [Microbacterium sp. LRZ72]
MTVPAPPRVRRLAVHTREVEPIDDILSHADPHSPLAWLRRGEGFIGLGCLTTLEVGGRRPGPDEGTQAAALAEMWRSVCDAASVDDDMRMPGTGLVAFGALAFDTSSRATSSLVVPRLVLGRRDGRSWITRIHVEGTEATATDAGLPAAAPWGAPWSAALGPGSLDAPGYEAAVEGALAAIAAGEVSKVVLARDLAGTVPADADLRRLVRALSTGYPDVWTYAVDGIIGASPETLVTVHGGSVTARVLAGTAPRGADPDADTAASLALADSDKDQDEHGYAVRSVMASLRPHTTALAATDQPFTLKLPNVWHLATDIEGDLAGGTTALDLVGALHPTAAVAGTPTPAALEVIRRLEPFDRGRYAGPVGWIDAHGDGEWAIALRCAQFAAADDDGDDGWRFGPDAARAVTAHAGAGIVAGSDPEAELLETRMKFRPIIDALA